MPRPQLAGALARALSTSNVAEHAVATVATELLSDVVLCDQIDRLTAHQRVALRRAEGSALDAKTLGVPAGSGHRVAAASGTGVLVLHGDGWTLVGRDGPTLLFLIDNAPGVIIDRSWADGALDLIIGLAERLG